MDPASPIFEARTDVDLDRPTLIEGLPGHGLVASIAVDQITLQLGMEYYGRLYDETFPQVLTFQDGMARDPVRVYATPEEGLVTLQSDLAIPHRAFGSLSKGLFESVDAFGKAVFLAGAPAGSESERGTVMGIATTERMKSRLEAADIDLAADPGVIGGVTGALARACHRRAVPTAVLVVNSHPYLPDPGAAQSVIESALEPLVEFDIDTTELEKQATEIQERMQQIAEQYEQLTEQEGSRPESGVPGMYQ
ncbi:MAG: proteasome assembly chaperone family protein [Halodesulfurarchaeum sp.]